MANIGRKARNFVSRVLKKDRIRDNDLSEITCIRYTTTWRCNFKCLSCSIWEKEAFPEKELTPAEIDELTKNPLLKNVNEVVFSGGEPLLREDFDEIVLAMYRNLKKARFIITTNGYNPEKIHSVFSRIKKAAPDINWALIGVSLNGPKDIHDKSRGVPGSFETAIETAKLMKEFSHNVDFSFTFVEDNVQYYQYVTDLAKELGIGVHICWTVMNDRFDTNEKDLVFQNDPSLVHILEDYSGIDKHEVKSTPKKDFFRDREVLKKAYLYDSIINKRIMPCNAFKTFFHLDPYGNIYPCNFKLSDDRLMGNIKEKPFEEIWKSGSPQLYNDISAGKCMYPNGVCGDSDLMRSIHQTESAVYNWYKKKREKCEKFIRKSD